MRRLLRSRAGSDSPAPKPVGDFPSPAIRDRGTDDAVPQFLLGPAPHAQGHERNAGLATVERDVEVVKHEAWSFAGDDGG